MKTSTARNKYTARKDRNKYTAPTPAFEFGTVDFSPLDSYHLIA